MANSSLHRHFHTHTKKLCKAPPIVVVPPPPCWPTAIPGKVQSRSVDYYGNTVCQSYEVFVAEKTGTFLFNCNYDFHYFLFSYPGHSIRISLVPGQFAVNIYLVLGCDHYTAQSSHTNLYPVNRGLSPHEYELTHADWTNRAPRHVISRFSFIV